MIYTSFVLKNFQTLFQRRFRVSGINKAIAILYENFSRLTKRFKLPPFQFVLERTVR